MIFLRIIASCLFFAAAIAFSFAITNDPLNWQNWVGAILCYFAAYYTWPSRKRHVRQDDNFFLNLLEFIIELPVDLVLFFIRGIFSGGGVDVL